MRKKYVSMVAGVMLAIASMFTACPEAGLDGTQPVTQYSVTFNANGGSVGDVTVLTVKVNEGASIGTLPVNPTRDTYTFQGWFRDKDVWSESFTASTPVNSDITVYAKWAGSTDPTVSGVTVSPDTVDVAKGGTQQFTAMVTGTNSPGQTVTWSVSGNNSPTTVITSEGILTVASNETAASLTITATSTVDITKSGSAAVTVLSGSGENTLQTLTIPERPVKNNSDSEPFDGSTGIMTALTIGFSEIDLSGAEITGGISNGKFSAAITIPQTALMDEMPEGNPLTLSSGISILVIEAFVSDENTAFAYFSDDEKNLYGYVYSTGTGSITGIDELWELDFTWNVNLSEGWNFIQINSTVQTVTTIEEFPEKGLWKYMDDEGNQPPSSGELQPGEYLLVDNATEVDEDGELYHNISEQTLNWQKSGSSGFLDITSNSQLKALFALLFTGDTIQFSGNEPTNSTKVQMIRKYSKSQDITIDFDNFGNILASYFVIGKWNGADTKIYLKGTPVETLSFNGGPGDFSIPQNSTLTIQAGGILSYNCSGALTLDSGSTLVLTGAAGEGGAKIRGYGKIKAGGTTIDLGGSEASGYQAVGAGTVTIQATGIITKDGADLTAFDDGEHFPSITP